MRGVNIRDDRFTRRAAMLRNAGCEAVSLLYVGGPDHDLCCMQHLFSTEGNGILLWLCPLLQGFPLGNGAFLMLSQKRLGQNLYVSRGEMLKEGWPPRVLVWCHL